MPELHRPILHSALLFATSICVGCAGGHREEAEIAGSFSVDPGLRTLKVELRFGSVTVIVDPQIPKDEVRYEGIVMRTAATDELWASLCEASTQFAVVQGDADVMWLRAPALPTEFDPASTSLVTKAVIRCPPGLRVVVTAERGHLKVAGAEAGAELRTEAGDLAAARCRAAKLQTGSGNILVDHNLGALTVESGGGLVQAYLAQPSPVQIRARDGIQLHMPRDAEFQLVAETPLGECVNAFGVPVNPRKDGGWEMRGTVRGGGPIVDVRSSRGSVSVGVDD